MLIPKSLYSSVILGPAVLVSPGSMIEMQTLGVLNPHLHFNKLPRGFVHLCKYQTLSLIRIGTLFCSQLFLST